MLAILEEVSLEEWQVAEKEWIVQLRALGCDLVNLTDGGDGVTGLNAEARQRLSQRMTERLRDPLVRAALFTAERAAKISAALRGRTKTAEHVAKLKQNQPGRKLTPEHIAKIRANCRGHRWGAEEIEAIRRLNLNNQYGVGNRSRRGQKQTAAERQKKSDSTRGVPKSEEHREKIKQGQLRAWAKRKNEGGGQ